MRLVLFGLWFMAMPVLAATGISFQNDREGESFYTSKSNSKAIQKLLKDVDGKAITKSFGDILSKTEEKSLCAYDLNSEFKESIKAQARKNINYEAVIYYLRERQVIDDVVVKILLEADEVSTKRINFDEDAPVSSEITPTEKEMINLISSFEKKFQKDTCLDDAYKRFYSETKTINKELKDSELKALIRKAYLDKRISEANYLLIERARVGKINASPLSLKGYYSKLKSLRRSFPVGRMEKSNFVTNKIKKHSMSRRQKLLQNYSDIQIMLMGDVIRKLRKRLDTPKIEVLIYERDASANPEVLEMSPMGRVRFLVNQVLQKDMEDLKLSSYFNGFQPEYLDLITASYEIGLVAGSEVDAIAELEELWNPKKTFWDKAGKWIQTFASVASIVIPPPYGFLPALGLVVIQATIGNKETLNDEGYL